MEGARCHAATKSLALNKALLSTKASSNRPSMASPLMPYSRCFSGARAARLGEGHERRGGLQGRLGGAHSDCDKNEGELKHHSRIPVSLLSKLRPPVDSLQLANVLSSPLDPSHHTGPCPEARWDLREGWAAHLRPASRPEGEHPTANALLICFSSRRPRVADPSLPPPLSSSSTTHKKSTDMRQL